MTVLDCRDPERWGPALDEAVHALRRGELVVLPTDTGYGVAADAFDPRATAALGTAKGRPAGTPLGVLVADSRTLDGLCADVAEPARALVGELWPGPLTVVCRAQPSLAWDLGDTAGTVAVRVPAHPAALALLRRTGPLAVTGAHPPGGRPSADVDAARRGVGQAVRICLDAGPVGVVPSTVVDATTGVLRLVRAGALDLGDRVADPTGSPAPGPVTSAGSAGSGPARAAREGRP